MSATVATDDSHAGARARVFRGRQAPEAVAILFWDYPDHCLDLSAHLDLLISRVLGYGAWPAIRWLRAEIGDRAIRSWFERTQGRPLDRRAVRLWQALLELPQEQVDRWLDDPRRRIWDRRTTAPATT